MKTLSERLTYAMRETGFDSQTRLAKAAGVEQSAISKIVAGASKTSKHSGKLAAAMGISADWLINGAGTIYGLQDKPLQQVDASRLVSVYDENGDSGDVLTWLAEVPATYRAYIMHHNTGIAHAPKGCIVIVNPEQPPSQNDLVVTLISGTISVFRYHSSGDGAGFLSVDDPRIPLASVRDDVEIIGPIIQLFIPELSR